MLKLNITIPYDRILKIEASTANEISTNTDNNNGVFVPINIIYNTPLHFPIDNVDFFNDTPARKNEFHGVGQIMLQKSSAKKETDKSKFTIEASNKITYNKNVLNNIETFQEPSPPNDIFDFDGQIVHDKVTLYKTCYKVWTITSVINKNMPTWNAYNSLISKDKKTYYNSVFTLISWSTYRLVKPV